MNGTVIFVSTCCGVVAAANTKRTGLLKTCGISDYIIIIIIFFGRINIPFVFIMPKKAALVEPKVQKRAAPKKKKPIEEPLPDIVSDAETGSETDQEFEEAVLPQEKPKLIRQKAKKQVEVEAEPEDREVEDESEEKAEPAPRGRPKVTKKAAPKAPSLWLTVLKENGFMCKGGAFKPTPKKGTPDYEAVRKIFDERKAAASK